MIIEFPQAEYFLCYFSLRCGVLFISACRIVLVLLLSFFPSWFSHTKYFRYYGCHGDRPLLIVTLILLLVWLIFMILGAITERTTIILIAAITEVCLWLWFWFLLLFYLFMVITHGPIFLHLLLTALLIFLCGCYIIWIVWSYYVDEKARDVYYYEEEYVEV